VNGRMNPAYARDAFHLTPAGYDALTRIVSPQIAAALGSTPPEGKPHTAEATEIVSRAQDGQRVERPAERFGSR
jgi:hypothetical protein